MKDKYFLINSVIRLIKHILFVLKYPNPMKNNYYRTKTTVNAYHMLVVIGILNTTIRNYPNV